MAITWRSALLLMLIGPTVLVAAMLWWRTIERPACRWLAAFLIAFCLDTVPQIIGFAGAYDAWPWLTFAPFNYQPLFGPLMYLHAHTLMRKTPIGRRWWLLAPGALQVLYDLWAFTTLGDYRAKWAYTAAVHDPYIAPLQMAVSIALALGCAVATWRLLRRYRHYLRTTQSVAVELDPSWLSRFLITVGIALSVWISFEAVNQFVTPLTYRARYPMFLVIGALLLWLGLEALSRLRTPFVRLQDVPATEDGAPPGRDWVVLGEALRHELVAKSWHLEPRLSLGDLATRMATNESYVSRALNLGLGINFNTLVNDARIDTAKALMRAEPQAKLLDIAHRAGFNSKATFNRVFRQRCETTPSAFKRAEKTSQIR
ncbi:MAG: helix-turn-helix transcriptional regulator [Gammaproteobacteria bacterium]